MRFQNLLTECAKAQNLVTMTRESLGHSSFSSDFFQFREYSHVQRFDCTVIKREHHSSLFKPRGFLRHLTVIDLSPGEILILELLITILIVTLFHEFIETPTNFKRLHIFEAL